MAVELRNVLGADLELDRPLPATLVFKYPTISALSDYLAHRVLSLESAHDVRSLDRDVGAAIASDETEIEALSDESVRELLAEELGSLSPELTEEESN